MVLPSGRLASMVSGALLVADYSLVGLANLNPALERLVQFTPLSYYQGGFRFGDRVGVDSSPCCRERHDGFDSVGVLSTA
jgi:hypothetical protein